jgi:hypothetical protein
MERSMSLRLCGCAASVLIVARRWPRIRRACSSISSSAGKTVTTSSAFGNNAPVRLAQVKVKDPQSDAAHWWRGSASPWRCRFALPCRCAPQKATWCPNAVARSNAPSLSRPTATIAATIRRLPSCIRWRRSTRCCSSLTPPLSADRRRAGPNEAFRATDGPSFHAPAQRIFFTMVPLLC